VSLGRVASTRDVDAARGMPLALRSMLAPPLRRSTPETTPLVSRSSKEV
jgi:hypothetical protein